MIKFYENLWALMCSAIKKYFCCMGNIYISKAYIFITVAKGGAYATSRK